MALLADLGCRGSCENAHICPNAPEGTTDHVLYNRDDLDIWTVWTSGAGNIRGFKDLVYTPKGTPLTGVWKHAKQQIAGKIHKIICKGWGGYGK